jgi:hypothetical protein
VHLAAHPDDLEDLGADRVAVTAVFRGQLAEARGVEVEPLDPDPDLVGADPGPGVQPPRRLRQHPGGLDHPVQSHLTHQHHPHQKSEVQYSLTP